MAYKNKRAMYGVCLAGGGIRDTHTHTQEGEGGKIIIVCGCVAVVVVSVPSPIIISSKRLDECPSIFNLLRGKVLLLVGR